MARFRYHVIAALAVALLAACAAAPTPAQQIESTEQSALAPLKAKYPAIVAAFDITGNRLDLAIDANGYIRTDDDVIDTFKSDTAKAWKNAWSKAHPHQHATLTVRMLDYMSRVWAKETVKA